MVLVSLRCSYIVNMKRISGTLTKERISSEQQSSSLRSRLEQVENRGFFLEPPRT
jgi:hypothetical protein